MDLSRRFLALALVLAALYWVALFVLWARWPFEPWVFYGCGALSAGLVLFT